MSYTARNCQEKSRRKSRYAMLAREDMIAAMARTIRTAHRRKRPPRSRLLVWGICGLIGLAAAAPTLGADTFDGAYTGKRVLTKGSNPSCVASDDVSVTINGGALTFTHSALRDFSIGFDPHQDGSFRMTSVISGDPVLIRGRIVGGVLDADVTNGPCEHHWHLTKHPS